VLDLHLAVADPRLEVVDLKQKVPERRSGGIRPNLTPEAVVRGPPCSPFNICFRGVCCLPCQTGPERHPGRCHGGNVTVCVYMYMCENRHSLTKKIYVHSLVDSAVLVSFCTPYRNRFAWFNANGFGMRKPKKPKLVSVHV